MLAAADTRRRRLLGLASVVAATALTVSGCAAGQDAQTVEQTSVVDGTAFQAGAVKLRDVGLRAPVGPSYAAGANVYLQGLVVNTAPGEDQLVSVTSPAATSVVFYEDGLSALLGTAPTPSASPTESASPTDTATPTDSGTPTDTGTPTGTGTPTDGATTSSPPASSSAAPPPSPATEIALPTNEAIQFGYSNDQPAIVLLGLKAALFPSQPVTLTFTFANGGTVTATVSVKLPEGGTLDAPTVDTHGDEGGE